MQVAYRVSFAEINVVIAVVSPNCELCVPVGFAFTGVGLSNVGGITAVGSTTAQGWIDMFMLLPLLSACEIMTPAKPTIAYVLPCPLTLPA